MKYMRAASGGLLTLIAALGLFPWPAVASDASCIESWSEAASVIRKENLVVIEQLSATVRDQLGAEIVRTKLCEKDGRFIYRLVVRAHRGALKDVSVDARTPFGR
jgi:hypothetical protein